MGAAVSRDTGARGVRRGTRLRGGASLAALLAAGALLAGCGTAVPEAADAEGPEPAAVAIPAPAEPEQDGAAADDAAGNASGIVTTGGEQGEGGQGQDGDGQSGDEQGQGGDYQGEDAPGPSAADLPASWAGTYSAEGLPLGGGYLVVQNLYGEHRGATSLEASDIDSWWQAHLQGRTHAYVALADELVDMWAAEPWVEADLTLEQADRLPHPHTLN